MNDNDDNGMMNYITKRDSDGSSSLEKKIEADLRQLDGNKVYMIILIIFISSV